MRVFNTAGPCDPEWHYMVPPEPPLPGARRLIESNAYFAVHAPRQTGKTTTLRALARQLLRAGDVAALHFSCEAARMTRDDYGAAENIILEQIRLRAQIEFAPELQPPEWPLAPAGARLHTALQTWVRCCPRPLALFFDEIDALQNQSLESVLGQLRAGFNDRPHAFVSSVVLCGLRDVRDYKAASRASARPARSTSS